ncbi:MAG: hypothetical protein K0Q57_783 [Gammaproteobacteria bacterium]|nr:hypothetical protein [Gammaproteobacteria bacterium]
MQIVNISTYKFVELSDIESLQADFKQKLLALGLKGTVVFSPEGTNIMLAGPREAIDAFGDYLRADARFADIKFKESLSETQPFKRLFVKLKKSLVPGADWVNPAKFTAPALSPEELKQWLEEGRDFTLIDTRNDYEVQLGTFENAVEFKLETFNEFPEKIESAKLDRDKPLVMFCTGGIRCEKASPVAVKAGFKEVYQLEGGILNYFERCGSAHYRGDCFVFDERVAVTPSLSPSSAKRPGVPAVK